jgi:hypothetical protein
VAPRPGHREVGLIRAARDAQPERRVLCRAVIGVQDGSRSKRQGWTRPAGRDGAPLADVIAVRGTPCAFAPGVAGHGAPLPQAGRGERPALGDVVLVRHPRARRRPARGLACEGTSKTSVASPAAR